ncbi:MAG: hypothetical protein HQ559_14140 [Lentisphaerae bacterium]|nr:hypothetical protein [Lentisphaerota bacterium]
MMRKTGKELSPIALVLIVVVAAAAITTGCEAFKSRPKEPDPQPKSGDPPNLTGSWDIELRTNGAVYVAAPGGIGMTIIHTDDEIEGNWDLGDVEGEVDTDGEVELKLRMTIAPISIFFRLKGEVEEDGDTMSGDWIATLPPPRDEGTWKAERN